MGYILLSYICSKQEVCLEMDEPILDLPEKEQGELLNIYGYPDVEEHCMFLIGVYFYVVFFVFC